MAVSGLGVAYATSGFVLLWSGWKNATIKDTLTSFLKGQPPQPNPTGALTVGIGTGPGNTAQQPQLNEPGVPSSGTVSGADEKANQTLGKAMAAAYGWAAGTNWTSLDNVVMAESGWNNLAQNPGSTAYGIGQFL